MICNCHASFCFFKIKEMERIKRMELNYIHESKYVAIFEKYVEALKKLKDFEYWETDKRKVKEVVEGLEKDLEKQYSAFANDYISTAHNKMRDIEREYKQRKREYTDPQAELLRRQDFDLSFSMMGKEEVEDLLSDPDQRWSVYELNKIKATFVKSVNIQTAVKKLLGEVKEPWLKHPTYKRYRQDLNALEPTSKQGLEMVYGLKEDGRYKIFDLSLKRKRASFDQLSQEISDITAMIQRLKTQKPNHESEAGLLSLTKPKKAKVYKYEEFDPRIFEELESFDATVLYQYLKERYPEDTEEGGRWFMMRPDFDIMEHYEYLKHRQEQRLAADKDYSQQYRQKREELRAAETKEKLKNPTAEDFIIS